MAKDKTKNIQKMVTQKASKQSANKVCEVVAAAEGRTWQARSLPPLARANAAEEVSRLLALLNGAELELATTGGAWRCRARQIFFPEKNATKNVAKNTNETLANIGERVPSQGRWSLLLSLGDTPCLCRLDLPANLRAALETMSAPYKLEELPSSVALGLLSLALSPLLREIFLVPCRLVEHGVGVEKKTCAGKEVAFLIEALPIKQEGTDEGTDEDARHASLQLQVFLATRDLAAFARSLRIARQSRSYPPNLHTTWQLDGGETSLSLEEFRALKEGDVLLLS